MNFTTLKETQVSNTEEYKKFSKEFDYYIDFFYSLSELISYNGHIISFMTNKGVYLLDTSLINSSVQTLRNIKAYCSIGGFSDANTLIRKLRDDLVLYIFILSVVNDRKAFVEEDLMDINFENIEKFSEAFLNIRINGHLSDDEKAVEAWLNNTVDELSIPIKNKLNFGNYMVFLKGNRDIKQILIDYKLQDYWEKLQGRLNDYVHNNGRQFAHQNFVLYDNKGIKNLLEDINIRTSYISSFFLVLLLMIHSSLISSTDLINHLDSNIEPPEGCQYSIASFVQDFIDKQVIKLHPELKQYLIENNINGMKIE